MNFMTAGTISNHMNSLKLGIKYQERMKKSEKPKKDEEIDLHKENMERAIEDSRRGREIASIKSKMVAGSNLSDDEFAYLKEHCPDLYEEAVKIKAEKEAHEKELKNCKSKADVENFQQRKRDSFYTEAKQIMSNPNIPKIQKAIKVEFITMRINATEQNYNQFVQSGFYRQLPDERKEKKIDDADLLGAKNNAENNTKNELIDYIQSAHEILRNDIGSDHDVPQFIKRVSTDIYHQPNPENETQISIFL